MMGRWIAVVSATLFTAACSQPVPSADNAVPVIAASVAEYHGDINEAQCAVVASGDPVLPKDFQPQWLTPFAPREPMVEERQRQLTARFRDARLKPARLAAAGDIPARKCSVGDSALNVGKIWIDEDFAFVDSALICGPECGSGRISAVQWDGRKWAVVGVANSWIS